MSIREKTHRNDDISHTHKALPLNRWRMANNLLQPTVARMPWSSFVPVQRIVPLLSLLPASGRATAAEQGR